jgi:hypothetical protein
MRIGVPDGDSEPPAEALSTARTPPCAWLGVEQPAVARLAAAPSVLRMTVRR